MLTIPQHQHHALQASSTSTCKSSSQGYSSRAVILTVASWILGINGDSRQNQPTTQPWILQGHIFPTNTNEFTSMTTFLPSSLAFRAQHYQPSWWYASASHQHIPVTFSGKGVLCGLLWSITQWPTSYASFPQALSSSLPALRAIKSRLLYWESDIVFSSLHRAAQPHSLQYFINPCLEKANQILLLYLAHRPFKIQPRGVPWAPTCTCWLSSCNSL